jgi:hypothetical protein
LINRAILPEKSQFLRPILPQLAKFWQPLGSHFWAEIAGLAASEEIMLNILSTVTTRPAVQKSDLYRVNEPLTFVINNLQSASRRFTLLQNQLVANSGYPFVPQLCLGLLGRFQRQRECFLARKRDVGQLVPS